MSKNATIDKFLNDQIADHSWLNNTQDKVNAPFADTLDYDAKGELGQQWGVQTPLPNEVHVLLAKKVAVVVNEVKRQLMLGKSLQHVKESILDRIDPEVKTAAKDELIKLAQEFPLLGSVYIEPEAFGKNASACEKGASLLKNNASRLAVYAKKMAACAGCSCNKGGYCRVYKKALVQEVPYNEKTLKHYQTHLAMSNKIATTTQIESKEELRQALLGKPVGVRQAQSVIYHDETKNPVKRAENYGTGYVDQDERAIAHDLSKKLAAGMEPELFKKYVLERYSSSYKKYPDVFKKYSSYVGSLGRVFVELEPFVNPIDAKNFVQKHAAKVPYVIADGRHGFVEPDGTFLGKKVVASVDKIPAEAWIANLRGKAFNAAQLAQNPLAVTKAAFLQPKAKTASAPVDTIEIGQTDLIEQELTTPTYNKKATAPTTKTASTYKPKPNKESNVKADGNKVRAMVDKNLEIEIEQSNYDDTISKYT